MHVFTKGSPLQTQFSTLPSYTVPADTAAIPRNSDPSALKFRVKRSATPQNSDLFKPSSSAISGNSLTPSSSEISGSSSTAGLVQVFREALTRTSRFVLNQSTCDKYFPGLGYRMWKQSNHTRQGCFGWNTYLNLVRICCHLQAATSAAELHNHMSR